MYYCKEENECQSCNKKIKMNNYDVNCNCKYCVKHKKKKGFMFYKNNFIKSLDEVECFLNNTKKASWYIKLFKLFSK